MYRFIDDQELAVVKEVLAAQNLCRLYGKYCSEFESRFAEWIGRKYCVAVNSGTSALLIALAACGVGWGDEVIAAPLSFVASSSVALHLGARPVFADVDPRTFCVDPADIEKKLTRRTRAVIVVHLFGQPCPMDRIMNLAALHRLAVIEDCSQAFGSTYRGRLVGSFGHLACYSLQQTKHMTAGEGGVVVTDDVSLYDRCRCLGNIGQLPEEPYVHRMLGWNFRLNELSAAIATVQLAKLPLFNQRRARFAQIVEEGLSEVRGIQSAYRDRDSSPVYWFYPLRLVPHEAGMTKAELVSACQAKGVKGIRWQYVPRPNYLEPLYASLNDPLYRYGPGLCPILEASLENLVLIPMHQGQEEEDIAAMARGIASVLRRR